MALKLSPEPNTVKLIRKARQLSSAAVAAEAKLSEELLAAVEAEYTELPKGKIVALAKALAVPTQFLFHKKLEIEENLPDFRTTANRPAILTSAGLARVQRAKSIISYLDDEVFEGDEKPAIAGSVEIAFGIERAANALRKYYSPVKRADGSVDPSGTFRETRVSIEKEGAIVLCDRVANDSFRGFCFSQKGLFPLILINTAAQRPATKLFTLMHEIVHVLLGRTGVSDPTLIENKVEQFCNRVTASVMMPKDAFLSVYEQLETKSVRRVTNDLAHHFGVSKQAAAIRVSELNLSDDFYGRWLRSLPPRVPPIEEEDEDQNASGGGGGIAAQVGRFGYLLPHMLGKAINNRSISVLDAYRLTNLKPNTFSELAKIGERRLEH
ncbi:ImmA/IrrE family metallo-endopeptidase [Sinorhizobium meliloti]|nr:ImmA/IrrE family metallo-endopeptidase [Sinorhizobium meliloti]MDW9859455.1 ImmA/IrrE family metallo-endopeptidase [Sinorhizobium meliloti]MDW9964576.1 ImmA/IrrE family metallo-endopeptidase [Sinorhizobium meliloti]MDX0336826.1 ImmA/IrrE family metallo-endopeptidase [Sinorhizobium meliloti]